MARAVQNFANDLELISDTIRSRTVSQIKGALQKKAYEAAGIEVQSQPQQIVLFYNVKRQISSFKTRFLFRYKILLPFKTVVQSHHPNKMQTLRLQLLTHLNQK